MKLIVAEGGRGLLNALDDLYPETRRQRCWFRKMSIVAGKVRKRNLAGCLKGLRKVYQARSRRAAEQAYHLWARRWAGEVECVERDLDSFLAYCEMSRGHWRMLRTTNVIERCFSGDMSADALPPP